MRVIILPQAERAFKARRGAVSMVAKGCIVASVLPLRCFLFLLPNCTNMLVCSFLFAPAIGEPKVVLPKYYQTAILHANHFRRVVNW